MVLSQLSMFSKDLLRKAHIMPVLSALDRYRCSLIKKICQLTGKNPLEYIYNDSFFSVGRHERVLKNTPSALAAAVVRRYHPKTVVDIGCGCGIYLREFECFGIDVLGIDGSPAAERNLAIGRGKFLLADLTNPLRLPRRFDAAICFEVAEHIPTETSAVLVDNITRASDRVIFTAAHKGQGGHDHINEQDPIFWITLFGEREYSLQERDTRELRQELSAAGAIFWLVDNLLIFKKK